MATIDDFSKLDIRIGTIVSAEKVPDADKLLILKIDVGETESRQILSGIAEFVDPVNLVGLQVPVICNLEPRTLRGHESNGMIVATGDQTTFSLLVPQKQVPPGSKVK
jgi:methionyl-tRNA synthetase